MIHKFNFTLKDVTPYRNVYFSRAFDIQGIVREEWLKENDLLKFLKEYQLITKKAYNEYIKECFPFAPYEAESIVKKINKASFVFDIEIRDQKTGEIHSKGWQKICFSKNDKLVAIPEQFKKALINNHIEQIARDNKDRLGSKEGYARVSDLLDLAGINNLNENETDKLADAFEKLGVKISFVIPC